MIKFLILSVSLLLSLHAAANQPTGEIRTHLHILSQLYKIDEALLHGIVHVESGYNVKQVGRTHNERGLMQLRPKYFPKAPFDVKRNLRIGVRYLAKMKELCYPKYKEAWFICYNVGPNASIKKPKKFPYYRKVMSAKRAWLKKESEARSLYARRIAQSEG